ncbi:hypothetical protein Save01_04013 [Streptomyces avermitilis]|uniref:Secreted protein n=1 Tax=Streptomyces avermitilis (strain ATCC 31267 / DSM 46492 / JCM 5070 / NBRC 14893 / NCIMB 12804 / NRRL 8165 / MA-4680) TaxID=227882 RepID=Q82QL8_STRAW|nr:putative secreted protein [Streptomyces avermitilis MA-4680 = NBRC 14893]
MRTSIRIASVLAGRPLALGGVAFTAPPPTRTSRPASTRSSGSCRAGRALSSDELHYEERWEPNHPATTVRTWTGVFAWSVISGLIGEPHRVTG